MLSPWGRLSSWSSPTGGLFGPSFKSPPFRKCSFVPARVVAPRGSFLTDVRSRGRLPRRAGKTGLRAAHLLGRLEDSPPILGDVQDASLGSRWAGLGPPPPSCAFLFTVKKSTGGEHCVKRQRLQSRIMRQVNHPGGQWGHAQAHRRSRSLSKWMRPGEGGPFQSWVSGAHPGPAGSWSTDSASPPANAVSGCHCLLHPRVYWADHRRQRNLRRGCQELGVFVSPEAAESDFNALLSIRAASQGAQW